MEPFLEKFESALERLPVPAEASSLDVAFSGGLDSTVLLAALSRLDPTLPLRALHIDHGLHPDSARWAESCAKIAADLGVAFSCERVTVRQEPGCSLEASAREARYTKLAALIKPEALLLTAHHADDQLETVLLRMLRGSGVKGLRGILPFVRFGAGYLARPLLEMSRDEIRAVAVEWKLDWIEDPTNVDTRFDRNYLRHEIVPALRRRWPSAAVTIGRAARQMTAAQRILDVVAEEDCGKAVVPARISLACLRELGTARRANLLRHVVSRLGLPIPSSAQLDELLAAVEITRADAQTQVRWPGGEARIFHDELHFFEPMAAASGPSYSGRLGRGVAWMGPEGRLELSPTEGPGLPDAWVEEGFDVRFRVGGERFKPLDSYHSRKLKKLLQVAGVVPWMRSRVPLLYRDSKLVAVGDLWLSDAIRDVETEGPAWRVVWSEHPPLN